MKHLITFLWFAFATAAMSETKFAMVRVTDIYRGLPSTQKMHDDVKVKRLAIMEDVRAEKLREGVEKLKVLSGQLEQFTEQTDPAEVEALQKTLRQRLTEVESLRQEFEAFKAEQNQLITREMVVLTRASLDRISAAAGQIAKERNLDVVLDVSGESNTGVPVLVLAAGEQDITEDVIEVLGEKEEETDDAETAEETEDPSPEKNQTPQE